MREFSRKAKLSVFKSTFVLSLPMVLKSWVLTKRVRSHMQASEIRFAQTTVLPLKQNYFHLPGCKKDTIADLLARVWTRDPTT